MARGKTTPASTAGSYAPASGRTSRVEIDTLADTQAEREQARIDRLWNCDDVTQVLSFHVAAWPHTKAGVAKLRGELASMGAATFAIRHDLDLRFDPMSKATPEETAAYCQAWLDNLEATKGTGERANQKVLDAMRATEEPVPAPTPVAGDGGYEALHRFDIGEDSSVEVFRSGRGFKVIRFNDGIGAEHGGDFFGADGGRRMVYTADSLALATLELSVHITGGRVKYVALQFEVPDHLVDALEPAGLKRSWATSEASTQRVGEAWLDSRRSVALSVPSALVDVRSGERNVLLNPLHPDAGAWRELQRFDVVLDERL